MSGQVSHGMRFVSALLGALLITALVFLFMRSLIQPGGRDAVQRVVHENVQILREQEPEEPEEQEQAEEDPSPEEPALEAMEVMQISPVAPQPSLELEMPAPDLALGEIEVPAVGDRWSAPVGAGAVDVAAGTGRDSQGFVEVVPFNTRRPNVPEVAWENKIDGWVLVAFTVTPDGRTRDIRVLDARPRGVFEASVVAAVEDWRYRLEFSSKNSFSVTLTQKVEVAWKNYPQNLPNVD